MTSYQNINYVKYIIYYNIIKFQQAKDLWTNQKMQILVYKNQYQQNVKKSQNEFMTVHLFNHHHWLRILVFVFILTIVNSEPSCNIINLPQVIPMQYTQNTFINLQKYFIGTNITFRVQPNNIYSNMKQQYFCRQPQSFMLGKVVQARRYQLGNNVYLAILGQSSANAHIYMVYYNILIQIVSEQETKQYSNNQDFYNSDSINKDNIDLSAIQAIEVPRFKIDNCTSMALNIKKDSLQFIIDCRTVENTYKKVLAYVNAPFQQNQKQNLQQPTWQIIQTEVYLDNQSKTYQYPQSQIQLIVQRNKKFLIRVVKNQIDSYIELWKWNDDNLQKQIINLYDKYFFNREKTDTNSRMELVHWQILGNFIAILDYYNGIHIVRINPMGSLSYLSLMKLEYYTNFFFDEHQEILFVGKKGRVQQYQIVISQIKTLQIISIREQLYHLVSFQNIQQIISMNRFLYVLTNSYTHVIHLQSMLTADDVHQTKGSYMSYPEFYGVQLFSTVTGFIKLSNYAPDISIKMCDINPPFLYLKSPFNSPQNQNLKAFNFMINGFSTFEGETTFCYQSLSSQVTLIGQDFIFDNGFNVENQTIYANKPGTSLVALNKYGFGKNINYEVKLINNLINFTSNIKKVNLQQCELGSNRNQPILSSLTIGNWLIIQYLHSFIKEYFICQNYNGTQCQLVFYHQQPNAQKLKSYNLIESTSGNGMILQANTYTNKPNIIYVKSIQENSYQEDELAAINNICQVSYDNVIMNQIQEITLRNGRLYVLLKNIKQIHIYGLLSSSTDNQCAYIGRINAQSLRWIYFSPQQFSFDGEGLIQQTVLSIKNSQFKKELTQISVSSSQVIYISQFNQFIIVKIFFNNNKIQLVRKITSFVLSQMSANCSVIIIVPYLLIVDKISLKINQYFLTQEYTPYFMRTLIDQLVLTGPIRVLSKRLVAVGVFDKKISVSMLGIYELDALVSAGKQYTYWNTSFSIINSIKFSDTQYAFIVPLLSQNQKSVVCQSRILSEIPYLQLFFPSARSMNQPTKQQFYLQLQTKSDFKRHVVNLQISNFINVLQRGSRYPFKGYALNYQENIHQKYFQIADTNWFKGNIFTYQIKCKDCTNGRIRYISKINQLSDIKLDAKDQPTQFYVDRFNSLSSYKIDIINSYIMTAIQPQRDMPWLNKIYKDYVSITEQNLIKKDEISDSEQNQTSYRFAQSTILSSQQGQCLRQTHDDHSFFFVTLCQMHQPFQTSSKLQIKLHSQTSFKSIVLSQYTFQVQMAFDQQKQNLKLTSRYSKQLILEDDLIVVRYYDNIYLLTILEGQIIMLDNFNKEDFGGSHICFTEIANKKAEGDSQHKNYTLIISLCQDGFAYMVFNIVQESIQIYKNQGNWNNAKKSVQIIKVPTIRVRVSQQVNLNIELQKFKIKIPESSLYLQTVTQQIQEKEMLIYTIVQNFNSFAWRIQLGVFSVSIIKIQLEAIIYRYGLFSAYEIALGQHLTILYRSTQQLDKVGQVVEYIAAYDPNNVPLSDVGIKQYYMFTAQTTQIVGTQSKFVPSRIRQIDNKLYVLSYNHLYLYETVNKIRIFVTNYYNLSFKTQQEGLGENYNLYDQKQVKPLQFLRANSYFNNQMLTDNPKSDDIYTQNIVVLVYTPVSASSVTLKLYAIDLFELSGLEIFVIVVGMIILIVVLTLIGRFAFRKYKQKQKLVPLLQDYEQRQDSDQDDNSNKKHDQIQKEEQKSQQQNKSSQDETQIIKETIKSSQKKSTQDYNINQSVRQSIQQQ